MQAAAQAPSLEDRQAIVDVTVRYCWAIDGRDWAELANVFTEDASAEYGFMPTIHGLSEIQALVTQVLTPLDCSQHMVTNHQIETHEGETRSRCYFQAQHTRKGLEGGANYIVAGIYRDAWSQTSDGWRIRSRALEVLWTEGNAAVVGRAPQGS
jgi:3-phenylpropionate/cinnamic acid dioxygenase small subunit